MSNLQTYYHFKLDFQKVGQHTIMMVKMMVNNDAAAADNSNDNNDTDTDTDNDNDNDGDGDDDDDKKSIITIMIMTMTTAMQLTVAMTMAIAMAMTITMIITIIISILLSLVKLSFVQVTISIAIDIITFIVICCRWYRRESGFVLRCQFSHSARILWLLLLVYSEEGQKVRVITMVAVCTVINH